MGGGKKTNRGGIGIVEIVGEKKEEKISLTRPSIFLKIRISISRVIKLKRRVLLFFSLTEFY